MAAKAAVRLASISIWPELRSAVDKGSDIDVRLKKLQEEDKECKALIRGQARGLLEKGEQSVRLAGTKSTALFAVAQKFEVNVGAEGFPAVEKAVEAGLLGGVIERQVTAVISPASLGRVLDELKRAGLEGAITVQRTYSVDAQAFRSFLESHGSVASVSLKPALKSCVECKESVRITYEPME